MNTLSNFSISSFEPAHTVIVLLSIHTLYNEMSQETDQYVQLIWGGGDPGEAHTQKKRYIKSTTEYFFLLELPAKSPMK